jgi:hypothetical protein
MSDPYLCSGMTMQYSSNFYLQKRVGVGQMEKKCLLEMKLHESEAQTKAMGKKYPCYQNIPKNKGMMQ